jgi:hypothetical protein
MRNLVKLMIAGLLTAVAATSSFADCNPPCRNGKVCRYDSTHTPPFFCRKPPTAQAASPAAEAKLTPRQPNAQYNPKEVGIDRSSASKCYREGGVNDTTHKRARGTGC